MAACAFDPLIPALRRQRQVGLSEFEATLVYKVCSKTNRATHKNPESKTNKNKEKKSSKQLANYYGN